MTEVGKAIAQAAVACCAVNLARQTDRGAEVSCCIRPRGHAGIHHAGIWFSNTFCEVRFTSVVKLESVL